jgi:hypothetical protein
VTAPPAWARDAPPEDEGTETPDEPRVVLRRASEMPSEAPPWLVQDVLYGGTLAMLYAPPESFKSFVAVALACCVAAGRPFGPHGVRQGPAVYVCAEGGFLIRRRVEAWCEVNGVRLEELPLWFMNRPLALTQDSTVDDFLAAVRDQLGGAPPALVTVDTLAECAAGANENSVEEMQPVLNRARRISVETGATTQLIHHTNAGAERERGSTALRGSCDTIWRAERDDQLVRVICDKQRDAPRHADIQLWAREEAGSLALGGATEGVAPRITGQQREMLEVLLRCHGHEALSTTEWELQVGGSKRTFYRNKSALLARGYVTRGGTMRAPRWSISDLGALAVSAIGAN